MAPGQYSTDPNDYPAGKADYALRNVDDNSRDALMNELSTVDLLIIDDFALESMFASARLASLAQKLWRLSNQ